jgi:hypothetical protein
MEITDMSEYIITEESINALLQSIELRKKADRLSACQAEINKLKAIAHAEPTYEQSYRKVSASEFNDASLHTTFTMKACSKARTITINKADDGTAFAKIEWNQGKVTYNRVLHKRAFWTHHSDFVAFEKVA